MAHFETVVACAVQKVLPNAEVGMYERGNFVGLGIVDRGLSISMVFERQFTQSDNFIKHVVERTKAWKERAAGMNDGQLTLAKVNEANSLLGYPLFEVV